MKIILFFLLLLGLNCLQVEKYEYKENNAEEILDDITATNECLASKEEMQEFFKKQEIEYKDSYAKDNKLRFIVGKCNPIVLIPGIYSTKLNVKIKCKNLYREEKDLYDKIKFYCGRFVCSSTTDNDENRYLWFNIGRSGFTLYRHPWEFHQQEEELLLEEDELSSTEDTWDWDNLYGACLGFFMRMFDNENECPVIESTQKKICGHSHNVRINYHGGFLNEIKRGQCGVRPVSNILESGFKVIGSDISATNIFGELAKGLVDMGYSKGFSLSAVPYDFRRFIATNEFAYNALEYHIDRMYELTGKPVIIIAHSFGNLITLNALQKLGDLKKKIKKWISLAPPFAGATKAIDNFLYGTGDFNVDLKWWEAVRFEKFGQFLMLRSIPTAYELKPFKTFWDLFHNGEYSDFSTAIRDRLELEKECYNGKSTGKCTDEYIKEKSQNFDRLFKDYYPSMTNEECNIETSHSGNAEALYKKCYSYIYNIVDYPTLIKVEKSGTYDIENYVNKTGDDIYYTADCEKITESKCYEEVMKETKGVNETFQEELYVFINRFKNRYNKEIDISDDKFFETDEEEKEKIKTMIEQQKKISLIKSLPPPDIDIDIVYSSFHKTLVSEFIYKSNLSLAQEVLKGGDGTVPSWSTLLTAFKWIYEKQKAQSRNTIRLIEYCSRIDNSKLNLRYFKAIKCRCLGNNLYTKDLEKCSHQNMLGDEKNLFLYIYDEIKKDVEDAAAKTIAIQNYTKETRATDYYEKQCNEHLYELSSKEQKIKCSNDMEITEAQYKENYCGKQNYGTMKSRDCCSVHAKGKSHDLVSYDLYYCDNVINSKSEIASFIEETQQSKLFFEDNKDVTVEVICSGSYLNYFLSLFILVLLF